MKRRQFLKSTAAFAGTAGFGFSEKSFSQAMPDVIHVGHLVGICMSPLFYAQATGLFEAEGLKVELKFMPNPGDALTALTGGVQHDRAHPVHQHHRRGEQRRAGAHHRRQRRGRPVPDRAGTSRHQVDG